ncbi:MAG: hypothetical protein MUQ56_14945 [Thermoleophilia bacterium]|nr:hypothetical protein [Thermoleophilia bacterium]
MSANNVAPSVPAASVEAGLGDVVVDGETVTAGAVLEGATVVETPVVTGGAVFTEAEVIAVVPPHPVAAMATSTASPAHDTIRIAIPDMSDSSPRALVATSEPRFYPAQVRPMPGPDGAC